MKDVRCRRGCTEPAISLIRVHGMQDILDATSHSSLTTRQPPHTNFRHVRSAMHAVSRRARRANRSSGPSISRPTAELSTQAWPLRRGAAESDCLLLSGLFPECNLSGLTLQSTVFRCSCSRDAIDSNCSALPSGWTARSGLYAVHDHHRHRSG